MNNNFLKLYKNILIEKNICFMKKKKHVAIQCLS